MKNNYFLFLALCAFNFLDAQVISIPDANFKAKLLAASATNQVAMDVDGVYFQVDTNENGQIEVSEVQNVYYLNLANSNISSLTGISSFSGLHILYSPNNHISSFSFSGLSNLENLYLEENDLSSLDATQATNLVTLKCTGNGLSSLNVQGLTNLAELYCANNYLTSLNVAGLNCYLLDCSYNQLTALDVSTTNNLQYLSCSNNQITALDLSNMPHLNYLYCPNNQITSLDLSHISLERLYCSSNLLTAIDVSGQLELLQLYCDHNAITTIDVRGLAMFDTLVCNDNSLTSLYIKNNRTETDLNFGGNPNLAYLCADALQMSEVQGKINTYGYTGCTLASDCSANNSIVYIPDTNFKAKLLSANPGNAIATDNDGNPITIDTNADGKIQLTEALSVKTLNVNGAMITDMTGIRSFENLVSLNCQSNQVSDLNVSGMALLAELAFNGNPLTDFKASGCGQLQDVDFTGSNQIARVDLSGCSMITTLNMPMSGLYRLNMSGCTALTSLDFSGAAFLSVLDLSGCTGITALDLTGLQNIVSLNVSNCTALMSLNVRLKQFLTDLNISGCTALEVFKANSNHFPSLDLTGLTSLTTMECINNNELVSVNFGSLASLTKIDLSANTNMSGLSFQGLVNLHDLFLHSCELTSLDLSGLGNLATLDCSDNNLTSLSFPDQPNLGVLYCSTNSLTSLSLESIYDLHTLDCGDNQLTSLNVTPFTNLDYLNVENNPLTGLDLSGLTHLTSLYALNNTFGSLDLSDQAGLTNLFVGNDLITTLDLSPVTSLTELLVIGTQLTALDLSPLVNLNKLTVTYTALQSVDISAQSGMQTFYCYMNPLVQNIRMKNGHIENEVMLFDLPSLAYICADEDEAETVKQQLQANGLSNCEVNSYCSLTPGGALYAIHGNIRLDSDGNGCDASDAMTGGMKFSVSNGAVSQGYIANTTGAYSIAVGDGNYTVTPVLENPAYFTVSPTVINVSLPADASAVYDFCLTPIGQHPDLEVSILPIGPALPGFDVTYKIVYKNKGNTIQAGSVKFAFDDTVLDLVSTSPAASVQEENLFTWNFQNLLPMQSGEILVALNLNSPVETPAVNDGDLLNFTASVSGDENEENPQDNVFTLIQTVVNSLDPNDKTCLEGNSIGPDMIGKYVHYMIRFENTGTFPATNIVVKDMIDTAKFDIGTLAPVSSSHPFTTRISNGNKVEFLFGNINLPFQAPDNGGFVTFKIRTWPTLATGDTLENTADIYFDYNAPVVTNTATTTFEVLSAPDFEFSDKLRLYPNPVSDKLTIKTKQPLRLQSASVYNMLGQLVIVKESLENDPSIEVLSLEAGTYFIKILTDKGTAVSKFIKK